MGEKLQLAVTPNVKLRESQARLYGFILDKHKLGETINLSEVIEQYTAYGCRNFVDGKPAGYTWDSKLIPLTDDELKSWALQWFIRNLGIFVVKGLLTAIPTMELSDIKIDAHPEPLPTQLKSVKGKI